MCLSAWPEDEGAVGWLNGGRQFLAPYLSLRASPAVTCEGTLKTGNRLLPKITSALDKVTLRH